MIIPTFIAVTSALSPIVAALVGGILARKVTAVHTLVNAQRTTLENRIAQLEATIAGSDKDIPPTTRETGPNHLQPGGGG